MASLKKFTITFLVIACLNNSYAQDSNSEWIDQPLKSLVKDLESLLIKDLDSALLLTKSVIEKAKEEENLYFEARIRRIQISALWLLGNYEQARDSIVLSENLIAAWISETDDEKERDRLVQVGITISNEEGRMYARLGKHKEAVAVFIKNVKSLENRKQTPSNKQKIAAILANVAVSYKLMGGKLDSAIIMYQKSLAVFKELEEPYYICGISLNLGIALKAKGDYTKALEYYLEGLNLAVKNDLHLQGNLFIAVISLYQKLKDYELAIQYGKKGISIVEKQNNPPLRAHILISHGTSYLEKTQYDSALYYLKESLLISEAQKDPLNQADAYQLVAKALIKQEKYDLALEYVNKGVSTMVGHSDEYIELQLLLWKAKCMLELGNITAALNSAQDALKLAETSGNNLHKRNVFELSHEIYSKLGNHDKAYTYLQRYSTYQDSVLSEEKTLEIARVEYDYQLKNETERLESEKQQQAALYEKELEKERLIQFSAFGGAAAILVILLILYRSYLLKQRKNKELSSKNELIELKNNELATKNGEITALREIEKKMAEETIAFKERELTTITMASFEKNSLLQRLGDQLSKLTDKVDKRVLPDLKDIKKTIKSNLSTETWASFTYHFEQVHPDFFEKLKELYPDLSQNDLKMCAYLKVGLDNKVISQINNVTVAGVKKSINRLKKKLEIDADDSIRDFVLNF